MQPNFYIIKISSNYCTQFLHVLVAVSHLLLLAGSQISQKIKSTYKTSTSRFANTFKSNGHSGCGQLVRAYTDHTDGVWEVSVSHREPRVLGTASAGESVIKLWVNYLFLSNHIAQFSSFILLHPLTKELCNLYSLIFNLLFSRLVLK